MRYTRYTSNQFKTQKKEPHLRTDRILILVLILIIIIAGISLLIKNNKTEQTVTDESLSQLETSSVQDNVKNITENSTEPIDSFANVNVPVYKKSEKNIKIPILIYHNFRTPIPYDEDIYNLFSCQGNFDENIKTLLDAGYTFITLEDLYRYNNNEIGLPEKVMIITMDDGQIGCYTEAFPVLKKYNVPATIFIVNTLVGTTDYFTWDQAKEMYDTGLVKIHCHGYKHSAYSNVSKQELINDYTKSHKEIEEHLGNKVQKIMAYPAGDSSPESIETLKEIGFEIQVQTHYGTVNKSKSLDLTNLGRIRSERATGNQILASIGT